MNLVNKYIMIKGEDHFHSVVRELRSQNYELDINSINPDKSPKDVELIGVNHLKRVIVLYKITPKDLGVVSNKQVLNAMKFEEIYINSETLNFSKLKIGDICITRDFKRAELMAILEPKTFKSSITFNLMWVLENGSSFSTTSEGRCLISQESCLDIIKEV